MSPLFVLQNSLFASLIVASLLPASAEEQQTMIVSADPKWAMAGSSDIAVTLTGNGLNAVTAVRFVSSGPLASSGITVQRVSILDQHTLVALISVAEDGFDVTYDVEIGGDSTKAANIFSVLKKPGSSFGCTGVEVWRQHRTCRRDPAWPTVIRDFYGVQS